VTIDEARKSIGRTAVYTPAGGDPETGVITSTSQTMAFVLYAGDQAAKATYPEDLALLDEHVRASQEAAESPAARPGILLRRTMQERGLYDTQLAERSGLTVMTVRNVLDGANRIDEPTAERLAAGTGTSAQFWLNAQAQYDADIRRGAKDVSKEHEHD
jgi:addiction module HigA family antidote